MTARFYYDDRTLEAERASYAYARRVHGEGVYSAGFRNRPGGTWQYELVKTDRLGVVDLAIGVGPTLLAAIEDCNRQLMAVIVKRT